MSRLTPERLPNWPWRMKADLASAYLGISKEKFLKGVAKGNYPPGVEEGRDKLWLRIDLENATRRVGSDPYMDAFK